MIFSRIIYCALGIGIATGLLLSLLQILTVDPIIFAAETFEISSPAAAAEGHAEHDHDHHGWAPADGVERSFYTILSNICAGIGFAAVLLALMSQFWLPKRRAIRGWQGLLWGLAGFAAIYLSPGIGLPPEIPGIEAAPVSHRQAWWILSVACTTLGIGLLALAPPRLKLGGLAIIAVPYLVGAPSHPGPAFTHPDPAAIAALVELHHRFMLTSGVVNLFFWLALGLSCGYAFNRWFRPLGITDEHVA